VARCRRHAGGQGGKTHAACAAQARSTMIRLLTTTMAGICAGLLCLPSTGSAETVSGRARVIDGDTVVVSGVHVRLKGIDSAERGTVRGEHARSAMIAIVGGHELTCSLTGERTRRREVGFCRTAAGVDIGQAIVASGNALACPRYSERYIRFEQPAALAVQPRASPHFSPR
jgi:endonuclease YncB( thermonuclease family)